LDRRHIVAQDDHQLTLVGPAPSAEFIHNKHR
jgi:hypothetical protein